MPTNNANQYRPDSVTPPGHTLADVLAQAGLTPLDLAARLDRPAQAVNALLAGQTPLSPAIAARLESTLNIPARFWLARERLYRQSLSEPL